MNNFWNRALDWCEDGGFLRFVVFSIHFVIAFYVLVLVAAVAFVSVIVTLEWYALALIPVSYAFWIAVILRQTRGSEEANT